MKIKQKMYFLALQKFLSLEELIIFLDININDIKEVTKNYCREYPNQSKYFLNIFVNRFIFPTEIINYIYLNEDNLNIDKITSLFNIDRNRLISLLYYLAKKHSKLAIILASNNSFHSELKDLMKFSAINRVKNSEIKLFRNNPSNTKKLLTLSKRKSIEELSLIFSCSPQIIEEELVFLGVGGYWANENIRTNSPLFVGNSNIFSKSEIIYLIRNIGMKTIYKKLNTTKQNIEKAISIIEKIDLNEEDLIKFINNEEKILDKWVYFKNLLSLKKENEKFVYKYTFKDFMLGQELSNVKNKSKILKNNWDHILDDLFKGDKYFFVTNRGNILGKFLSSNPYSTSLEVENKIKEINNVDIILYKKIS